MTADEFLGDFSGTRTRTASYVFERDEQGRVIKGVEIYENKDYTIAPVTIAVNGVERAKSPRDRKLRWINKSTVIIIGGKKSTWADFLALKEGDYKKIYYFRPKGERADECSFVYVSTPQHQVASSGFPVILVNLVVQKDVTDSQVRELIANCIDADDPDVYLYMQKTRHIISEDGNGNRTVRSVYDDNTDNLSEHKYVDLGLSVMP